MTNPDKDTRTRAFLINKPVLPEIRITPWMMYDLTKVLHAFGKPQTNEEAKEKP